MLVVAVTAIDRVLDQFVKCDPVRAYELGTKLQDRAGHDSERHVPTLPTDHGKILNSYECELAGKGVSHSVHIKI